MRDFVVGSGRLRLSCAPSQRDAMIRAEEERAKGGLVIVAAFYGDVQVSALPHGVRRALPPCEAQEWRLTHDAPTRTRRMQRRRPRCS